MSIQRVIRRRIINKATQLIKGKPIEGLPRSVVANLKKNEEYNG